MAGKLPTTVIGSFPKPDYLPIRDWFDSAREVAAPRNEKARRQPVPTDHSVFWQMPRQASGKMAEFQLHWTSQHFRVASLCNRPALSCLHSPDIRVASSVA